MIRYRGYILALLLTVICLWINVYRYPCVREMVEGKYVPQSSGVHTPTAEEAEAGKIRFPGRSLFQKKEKPNEKREEEKGVIATSNTAPSPFRNVSNEPISEPGTVPPSTAAPNMPRARAPMPIIPHKEKSKPNRPGASAEADHDEDAGCDNVFHDAIWSRPVPEGDSENESGSSNGKDEKETNPSTVYRAAGSPGTCPLDSNSPSYAPNAAYVL